MIPSELEDSNDSWTTEEFSSEFIMRYGSRYAYCYICSHSILIFIIEHIRFCY